MIFNSETKFLGHYSSENILDVLTSNLSTCDSFRFSVSFIMNSGLNCLYSDIEKALKRGAKGEIITTDYMRITQTDTLRRLLGLMKKYPKNFKAYFLETKSSDYSSFHTKGYIFVKDNVSSIIIGSSNMSATALSKGGGEWSLFSTTYVEEGLFKEIDYEFETNKNEIKEPLNEAQISQYAQGTLNISYGSVEPNYMQKEALEQLNKIRSVDNKNRALIVAAMGSGKTYLSAFDTKNMQANRILYVCHSDSILRKAKIEYETIYQNNKTYGFYSDGDRENKADIIFGTNISLAKHLKDFDPSDFDYIVIDEAHHGPASTYLKIINYFKPSFLLGMTGTPDRCDQLNVKEIFGDNIPYELSLRDAILNDLIMPFKYYSVYDETLNYAKTYGAKNLLDSMVDANHGKFIDNHIKMHMHEINGKLKCLAFCVDVDHAQKLAELMRRFGYNTTYVVGGTASQDRLKAYNDLQDENNPLQIIFSVNVMNEGVDLPAINMSLFLRPTESSIIFIQQLGRSLRKHENKNKPIIIDFIGEKYSRSIYIAWALGELTKAPILTKPILKQIINGDDNQIKKLGVEIKIDDESRKEINEYLDKENFNKLDILKRSYLDVKKQLSISTFPSHCDYVISSIPFDLMRIISTHKSYYNFLLRIKEDNLPLFTKEQREFIDYLSSFLPLSREYEYRIIRSLIELGPTKSDALLKYVKASMEANKGFNQDSYEHALKVLLLETESEINKAKLPKYISFIDDTYALTLNTDNSEISNKPTYVEIDFKNTEFRTYVLDIISYGLLKYNEEHDKDGSDFELYRTYSRKEYTRVLNFSSVYNFQPGVFYIGDRVALFIDMIKKAGVEEHLDYGDKFITPSTFEWESQTETVIGNARYNKLTSFESADIFVRKTNSEDGVVLPYVYLGKGKLSNPRETKNIKKTLLFDVTLENKLPDYLFEQFNIEDK